MHGFVGFAVFCGRRNVDGSQARNEFNIAIQSWNNNEDSLTGKIAQ